MVTMVTWMDIKISLHYLYIYIYIYIYIHVYYTPYNTQATTTEHILYYVKPFRGRNEKETNKMF